MTNRTVERSPECVLGVGEMTNTTEGERGESALSVGKGTDNNEEGKRECQSGGKGD